MAVIRLSNEPILVISFDDSMDERQVIDLYMRSIALAEAIPGPVYRVIDLREAPLSAAHIVTTLRELIRGLAGAAVIPDMAITFVGQPAAAGVTFFDTLDSALAYTRSQVGEHAMSL